MFFWLMGLVVAALVLAEAIIVGIDSYQHRQNQKWIEQHPHTAAPGSTLVVFFSRSGNTEIMARKIAELKQADILPLQSARNQIGFSGHIEALKDARNTHADITPKTVDLSRYQTIYIGSPVWLYSPAPQVYEFAKSNDFTGKKVILFNSMNSKFEQKYIDEFANIVRQNGGEFVQHLYIIRGRMGQQMSQEAFLREVENKLE